LALGDANASVTTVDVAGTVVESIAVPFAPLLARVPGGTVQDGYTDVSFDAGAGPIDGPGFYLVRLCDGG
jgi:hypothetical protein